MSATDSRTLRERLTDALLGFIEDQRPIRQVTARRQSHNAFLLGVDAHAARLITTPRVTGTDSQPD